MDRGADVRREPRLRSDPLLERDLDDVLDELPERLVVGCGAASRMRPDSAALAELRRRGIDVETYPTEEAVRRFAACDPAKTAAALHLTC